VERPTTRLHRTQLSQGVAQKSAALTRADCTQAFAPKPSY
jgi:hypothetical protein